MTMKIALAAFACSGTLLALMPTSAIAAPLRSTAAAPALLLLSAVLGVLLLGLTATSALSAGWLRAAHLLPGAPKSS